MRSYGSEAGVNSPSLGPFIIPATLSDPRPSFPNSRAKEKHDAMGADKTASDMGTRGRGAGRKRNREKGREEEFHHMPSLPASSDIHMTKYA